jgi:hypothetical protein
MYAPPLMMEMDIQSNGIRIHAKEQGSGEPALVFLHYWGDRTLLGRQTSLGARPVEMRDLQGAN